MVIKYFDNYNVPLEFYKLLYKEERHLTDEELESEDPDNIQDFISSDLSRLWDKFISTLRKSKWNKFHCVSERKLNGKTTSSVRFNSLEDAIMDAIGNSEGCIIRHFGEYIRVTAVRGGERQCNVITLRDEDDTYVPITDCL